MSTIIAEETFTDFLSVAKGYAVSDKVKDDVWKGMLRVANKIRWESGDVNAALLKAEKDYKAETKAASMPGPWRSAKSVLLKLLDNGDPLITVDSATGEEKFVGKTKAQRKVKTTRQRMEAVLAEISTLTVEASDEDWEWFITKIHAVPVRKKS